MISRHLTTLPKEMFLDEDLDASSLGLLTYLLSFDDGLKITIKQLAESKRFGSQATVRKTIKRLCEIGYVRRTYPKAGRPVWEITETKGIFGEA